MNLGMFSILKLDCIKILTTFKRHTFNNIKKSLHLITNSCGENPSSDHNSTNVKILLNTYNVKNIKHIL